MVRGKVGVGTSNRCEDGNMSGSREREGATAVNKKWSDVQENEAKRKSTRVKEENASNTKATSSYRSEREAAPREDIQRGGEK